MYYTTAQGDTWDMIAKKIYNDESQVGLLLENNFEYIDVFIFDSGVEIYAPELEEEEESDVPDWREEDEEE